MSRVCQVTGKGRMRGNKVSHSNIKTLKHSLPNLQTKKFWVPAEKRWVKLRLSTSAIRSIDKLGIEKVLSSMRRRGIRV